MNPYKEFTGKVIEWLMSSEEGLTEEEANKRLEKDGYNELITETKIDKLAIFIDQFKSVIIYIMLFATVLSFLLQEYVDGTVILVILIINALIGYQQEVGAARSLEALKKLNTVRAKVFRSGGLIEMDAKFLVKGDVISLEPGDKIPADSRIIRNNKLKIEESSLTGESLAVEKFERPITEDATIGDQRNMLFSSTSVQEGSGRAIVTKTGMDTEIGKITNLVATSEEQLTPLQIRLDKFGTALGYAVIGICIVVFLVMGGKEFFSESFTLDGLLPILLVAVALAVAAVPSGLPAVVTIALSVGVKRLLAQRALVRKLSSVETLGSCNVICSDKTGTLTQNQMTVKKAWTFSGVNQVSGVGYEPGGTVEGTIEGVLYRIGAFCNNSNVYKKDGVWVVSGDPTEAALLISGQKVGIKKDNKLVKSELPFDSDRKLMSVLVDEPEGLHTYVKGAPDQLLMRCSHVLENGQVVPITDTHRHQIGEHISAFSSEALRVLAFAMRISESESDFKEEDLTFVGLQAMIDPPRPDVIESIKRTKAAGIRIIMITGDYKETAAAIGKEIGIDGLVISGTEIDKMTEHELEAKLEDNTNIFARVIPEHKQRIVSALQRQGHIVAMTGDGVNDAPALKSANIGIAVGSGTDAAKEASDFVLLDDSFTNIVNAIEEGRGIYDNIQKAIMHLLSGNLSEVLIIFISVLIGFELPVTAIMLLWINLVTDGVPALTLAVDPYGTDIMKRQPKDSSETILPKYEMSLITLMGIYSTIIGLFLFWFYRDVNGDAINLQVAQTTTFTFIVISEFVLLVVVRNFFTTPLFSNRLLWLAIGFCLVMQAVIIYVPSVSSVFGLQPLDMEHIQGLGIASLVLFVLCYITNVILRNAKHSQPA